MTPLTTQRSQTYQSIQHVHWCSLYLHVAAVQLFNANEFLTSSKKGEGKE